MTLRAVGPNEKAPRRRKSAPTVSQAAKSGNLRDILVATRDRIALAVEAETTPARELAQLAKRLVDITHEIDAIDQKAKAGADAQAAEVTDGEFDASAI